MALLTCNLLKKVGALLGKVPFTSRFLTFGCWHLLGAGHERRAFSHLPAMSYQGLPEEKLGPSGALQIA